MASRSHKVVNPKEHLADLKSQSLKLTNAISQAHAVSLSTPTLEVLLASIQAEIAKLESPSVASVTL